MEKKIFKIEKMTTILPPPDRKNFIDKYEQTHHHTNLLKFIISLLVFL